MCYLCALRLTKASICVKLGYPLTPQPRSATRSDPRGGSVRLGASPPRGLRAMDSVDSAPALIPLPVTATASFKGKTQQPVQILGAISAMLKLFANL